MTRPAEIALTDLPRQFSYTDARRLGLSQRRLYALRDAGSLNQIGRGLYQRVDISPMAADLDLLEISQRATAATLCLTTALSRHGLTDEIPQSIDVALPRGQRHPRTLRPVTWHSFAVETFDVGKDQLTLTDDLSIGIYSPERCIIDAFRLRHREGSDIAYEALRRWLRRPDSQPGLLHSMARLFPKAQPTLRGAMEALL